MAASCDSELRIKGVGRGRPRSGNVICAADTSLSVGKEAGVRAPTWHSHEIDRAGSFTLAVEPKETSAGLAEVEWAASGIFTATNFQYELRDRHAMNREIRVTAIMKGTPDLDMTTMTGAKYLHDCLKREQLASMEKRAALESAVIRDSLENLGGQRRWFPRQLNPADGLAKSRGNVRPLL